MNEVTIMGKSNQVTTTGLRPDLFPRFIQYLQASPATVATYTRSLRQFAKWLQDHGITNPQRTDILAYHADLSKDHQAATVQLYTIAIRLFFEWTEQEGLYPNVAQHLKGAKVDRRHHKKSALEAYQVKDIMQSVDRSTLEGARNYAMLALMFTAGLRTIEVARANIEDLDMDGGQSVLFVQGKGKMDKAASVNININAEKAIREYLKLRPEAKPTDPLFTSTSNRSRGQRLSTRSISKIVKGCMVQAGYNSTRLTAHSTRHTAVSLAIEAGATLLEAQQFARHASPQTTEIYIHELSERKNPCADKVAAAIF